MSKLKSWVLAARPKTLSASLVPFIATIGLVQSEGITTKWWIVACALSASLFIQIGTNLVNDAMDFKKGADTDTRLGPARATQHGLFTFKQVMTGATVCFGISALFGAALVVQGGWPIFLIGLFSISMGYAYTSGPYPLAYKGLGDLFVILFFGLTAVGGIYFLLTGRYSIPAFTLGLQIGCLSTVLIAINNLRDLKADALVNKKTLAVRLGLRGAKVWICFLIVAPFLVGYYWLAHRHFYFYVIPLLCFPIGLSIMRKIVRTEPSTVYNKYLAQSSAYAVLFSILFYVGTQIR